MPFWTYLFWSWLCMIPGTVLYVVGADAFTQGLAEGRVPWALIGALAVALVVLVLLVRYARRTLAEREARATGDSLRISAPAEPETQRGSGRESR